MFNRLHQALSILRHGPIMVSLDGYAQRDVTVVTSRDRPPGGWYLFSARMCCPSCSQPMKRSDRKEDWHVDPTGNAQYSCTNDNCEHKPRYRRVDILDAAVSKQDQARAEKQAQEHEAFERLTAMENRLTTWMRDRYQGYFRGQFSSVAEIAIYVMSKGQDGVVSHPLSESLDQK